jgi:CheY-like chemotaxis protein
VGCTVNLIPSLNLGNRNRIVLQKHPVPRFELDAIILRPNPNQWSASRSSLTLRSALILFDINMPSMSGLEMLPKIRAERPNVPVIMITADDDGETRRHAIAQGAIGQLTKPIDFNLLREEIDTRLGTAN